MSRIAVVVLGNRRSGKTTTWNALFGRTVRTGSEVRMLTLADEVDVPVFLVSGSPEERKQYVGEIVGDVDQGPQPDRLGFGPYLLHRGATLSIRDGQVDPSGRVREIGECLLGWSSGRRIAHA